ncbi:hypothetical protein AB0K00_22780 [Dactylosporangium sp. NPDC049525]|uniref:5'-methylthioadenosine/S-adenosylhomocysteine nucleosidase family protein n=1 Tax=Dactylosporangium sp. NPDC049525 TaxID=3154730 RepID=UPI0034270144
MDVLIVTALREEYDAAHTVGLNLASVAKTQWRKHDQATSAPYETIEVATTAGPPLSIALARPTRMGGRSTAPIATVLAERLDPQCLAMSGVCAGNPSDVVLGDVVVAEMTYEYDEGKRADTNFQGDHRHLLLDDTWIRAMQEFSPSDLPSFGPATRDEATLWFLERLLAGDEPRSHPARSRYFPDGTWRTRPSQMQADGLIDRSGQGWALTDEGRRFIEQRLYDDVDGPRTLPFAVKVAPMASGSGVVKDGLTWANLAQMGVRSVAALEMEAATIATVARHQQVPHWLVVKGVMDHADPRKDDRYKRFAARASAEVLYALLTHLVVPRPTQKSDSHNDLLAGGPQHGYLQVAALSGPATPASSTDGGDFTDAHQRTLQLVSELFVQHDRWPAFNLIDRPLRRQGVDAAKAVSTMPAGLLAGIRENTEPMPDNPIQLTVRGMARCRGTERDVALFLAATRWAAVLDDEFDPSNEPTAVPRLTSHDVAEHFHLADAPRALHRLYAMLLVQRWGFGSGGGEPNDWWWEISRDIQRFAAVTTADEYDRARATWVTESTRPSRIWQAQAANGGQTAAPERRSTPADRLDQLAASDPVPDAAARVNGHLYLIISPRSAESDVLGSICTPSATAELNAAVQHAIAARGREASFAPDFSAGSWRRSSRGIHRTDGVREDSSVREASLLVLTVCEDGSITVLCGRATDHARPMWRRIGAPEPQATQPVIFPALILGLTHSALALAGDLGQRVASYDGPWDVGLRLTGIKDAIAYDYVLSGDEDVVHPYDDDLYERTTTATTTDLAANADGLAERLVAPLLRALTIDSRYLPYRAA